MSTLRYSQKIYIPSLDALTDFARQLAPLLKQGDVIALNGTLGAGKTTLTQALGEAFGLREVVSSPTFVLMHEYLSGPFPMVHADLYRLEAHGADSLADALFNIIDTGKSILIVEWACYGQFLDTALTLSIDLLPETESDARTLTLLSDRPIPLNCMSPPDSSDSPSSSD